MKKELIIEKYSKVGGRSIYFEKYRDDKLIKTVKVISLVKEVNGFTYIILLDSCGRTIYDVYKYLNSDIKHSDWKRREKAMQALKIFFSFIELFNIRNYKSFKEEDLKKFKVFLDGGYIKGNKLDFECRTNRQASTINQYMSVYRSFLSYMGINQSVFHDKTIMGKYLKVYETSSGVSGIMEKYTSNTSLVQMKRIPKYIRSEEYIKILNLINDEDSKYGLRELLIIKLMYEYGLRISEVLGLTFEDIYSDVDKKGENEYAKIILRNRATDKQYQQCKNLLIPNDSHVYKTSYYNQERIGKHTVIVERELIDLMQEYIDDTRDVMYMTPIALKNINKAKADNVNQFILRENYYIFINKNYEPLSKSGWNKKLRQIFKEVGLEVDREVKRTNLNHRFRHGFAMLCIKIGVDRYTLKELLRHRNISTVDIYFNPTVEDNIETSIAVSQKIQKTLEMNINQIINEIKE